MGRRGEKPESKRKGTSPCAIVFNKLVAWDKALDKQFNKLTLDTLSRLPFSYYSFAIVFLSIIAYANVNGFIFEKNSYALTFFARFGYLMLAVLAALRLMFGLLNAARPLAFAYWASLTVAALAAAGAMQYSVWWAIAPVLQQTALLPLLASRNWDDIRSTRK